MNNSQHDSEEGNDNDNHTVGTSSTSNNNSSSLNKSNQVVVNNERTKNSYISMLSSCDDQPRDNVKGPQLKIRVKVIEENI